MLILIDHSSNVERGAEAEIGKTVLLLLLHLLLLLLLRLRIKSIYF